jgi:F0F1-type ATP synthase assembly protein I
MLPVSLVVTAHPGSAQAAAGYPFAAAAAAPALAIAEAAKVVAVLLLMLAAAHQQGSLVIHQQALGCRLALLSLLQWQTASLNGNHVPLS